MSAWPGKYVIGLTGNIATGKSVVRRMLEHLGAYGIDADALGHRAIAKGAPGYQPVLDMFGTWILGESGQIDRAKLARIVFLDPQALTQLEEVVHPLVGEAVDLLVRRSKQRVIVLEAIKLLESDLRSRCDSIWVTSAPQALQLSRLTKKRQLSEAVARQRITAQSSQQLKINAADVIIRNEGGFEDTWQQVLAAWQKIFPAAQLEILEEQQAPSGELVVQRAGPRQAGEIAAFITHNSGGRRAYQREDVMAAFGDKAYLLLKRDSKLLGLAGWQVENLVARVNDLYLEADLPHDEAFRVLTQEVERASKELQCEIALFFLPKKYARRAQILHSLGYQQRSPGSLNVRAWQEAAKESMPTDTVMYFKQLRRDRVLRPV
ncbi:MAG: dephospho-CoA kinase [Anaerolineales bacterium]|nr:MAG: dephospho-CoA kinase [Anaerolineales bacterium]